MMCVIHRRARLSLPSFLPSFLPFPSEVLLSLTTGGGTVTGYGLAAAQLLRLKARVPPRHERAGSDRVGGGLLVEPSARGAGGVDK